MEQPSVNAGGNEGAVMAAPPCNYPDGYQIAFFSSLGFVLSFLFLFLFLSQDITL